MISKRDSSRLLVCNYQQHSPFPQFSVKGQYNFLPSNWELSLFRYKHLSVLSLPGEEKWVFSARTHVIHECLAFQFGIFLRCVKISLLMMLILPCCVTHYNSFFTVIIHWAFLSWSTGLFHNSIRNLIDSSASGSSFSCLIFPSNSSYKGLRLFLKVLFCRYRFTLDLIS